MWESKCRQAVQHLPHLDRKTLRSEKWPFDRDIHGADETRYRHGHGRLQSIVMDFKHPQRSRHQPCPPGFYTPTSVSTRRARRQNDYATALPLTPGPNKPGVPSPTRPSTQARISPGIIPGTNHNGVG